MEALLRKLVSFPSVSDDQEANHALLSYISRFLETRGMYTQHFEPNRKMHEALVASTRPDNDKQPIVLLQAHVDVVPAHPDMFTLRKQGDKYIGRGVYDMKCAIAAYMKLVDELQDHLQDYNFAIMLTSDEELGGRGSGARELVDAGHLPNTVVVPDGARDWQLESGSKGYIHYQLEAHGKSAHGSRPWEGENAVMKLLRALHELEASFAGQHQDSDTLNVGAVEGGEVANRVPHYAKAQIEMRPAEDESVMRLRQLVQAICKKHDVKATLRVAWGPVSNRLDDPYVTSFADCIEEVVGIKVTGIRSLGGSDARFFARKGVPYSVFYPYGGGHHSADEWLDVKSLQYFIDILRLYVERVAKDAVNG